MENTIKGVKIIKDKSVDEKYNLHESIRYLSKEKWEDLGKRSILYSSKSF